MLTRADLKSIISRWVPDASTAEQDAAILVALQSLQQALGLGEEIVSDVSVSAGAGSATVPSTIYMIEGVIWQPSSDYVVLTPVPYRYMVNTLRPSNLNAQGTPRHYASTGSTIYLWEVPNTSGTLRITGLGAFGAGYNLDNDADVVHPSFAEPSIVAYKAILDMLVDRRQAMTVYREVLPIYRAKLKLCTSALKGIQGQAGAPDALPSKYRWSDY